MASHVMAAGDAITTADVERETRLGRWPTRAVPRGLLHRLAANDGGETEAWANPMATVTVTLVDAASIGVTELPRVLASC